MKHIVVDFSALDDMCGFGEIARNYCPRLAKMHFDDMRFIFILPEGHKGEFGDHIDYVAKEHLKAEIKQFKEVDLWHATDQQFRYRRKSKGTLQLLTVHDLNYLREKHGIHLLKTFYPYWAANMMMAAYGEDLEIHVAKNKYGLTYKYTINLVEPEDISGGYLLEFNGDEIDEDSGFYTRKNRAVNVKSPKWAGKEAMTYISELYQEFEDAVYATDLSGSFTGYNVETGKYYYDYVDKDSLVKTFLMKELSQNPDDFIYSTFLHT